jgi:CheY-like chemotaxis protein
LFAEDEEILRTLFSMIFRQHGFEVLMAVNGREALDIASTFVGEIHLLVSDVQMPEMTGPDLARALRKSRPHIRIMLLSGNPQGVLLLDDGWVFLKKPVSPADVMEKIDSILGRAPARDIDRGNEPGVF